MKKKLFENIGGNQFKLVEEGITDSIKNWLIKGGIIRSPEEIKMADDFSREVRKFLKEDENIDKEKFILLLQKLIKTYNVPPQKQPQFISAAFALRGWEVKRRRGSSGSEIGYYGR